MNKLIKIIQEEYTKLMLHEKTLYHGTLIDNVPSIQVNGLIPTIGEFVRDTYTGASEMDIEDYVQELVFATDKKQLSNAVTAITAQIAKKLKKSFHDVTDDDFLKYGALAIIKNGDKIFDYKSDDDNDYRSNSASIESGDYYSDEIVEPDFILSGNKLGTYLKKFNLFPRPWQYKQ